MIASTSLDYLDFDYGVNLPSRYKQNPANMTVAVWLTFHLKSGKQMANTIFL
jgi:hypothetical protein